MSCTLAMTEIKDSFSVPIESFACGPHLELQGHLSVCIMRWKDLEPVQNAISLLLQQNENQLNHRMGRIIENSFLFPPFFTIHRGKKSNGIY